MLANGGWDLIQRLKGQKLVVTVCTKCCNIHPLRPSGFYMHRQVQESRRGCLKVIIPPRRKQATATKLGIYSTYSPRSSIHFLDSCSNLCKQFKQIQKFVRPTRSPRKQWYPCRTKNGHLSIVFFFQSREQVVVRWGQIRRIGWVIKTLEAKIGQFLLGCKWRVSRGIVVQEQDHLGTFPRRFYFKTSFNCTSRDE